MPYLHHVSRRSSSFVNLTAVAVIIGSVTAISAITGVLPAFSRKAEPGVSLSVVPLGRSAPEAVPALGEACRQCGVIEAVRQITVKGPAGALDGEAIVGSQFGQGHGRSGITLTGVEGATYAGSPRTVTTYRVSVRMDDGTARTVYQSAAPATGDKVRVINGMLVARS